MASRVAVEREETPGDIAAVTSYLDMDTCHFCARSIGQPLAGTSRGACGFLVGTNSLPHSPHFTGDETKAPHS